MYTFAQYCRISDSFCRNILTPTAVSNFTTEHNFPEGDTFCFGIMKGFPAVRIYYIIGMVT